MRITTFLAFTLVRKFNLTRSSLLASLFLVSSCAAFADSQDVPLDEINPSFEHRQATAIILEIMERFHYKKVSVNDQLSEEIFNRYLESLDPQKTFLLASDIDEYSELETKLDDALKNSQLNPIFSLFKRFRSRVQERAAYAATLLEQEHDFTIDEDYQFDRESAQWSESQQSLNELWRKRVKNDILSLRLSDQTHDEIIETLTNRYERMERRVSQLSANEVFQTFINAYTQSVEPHTNYFSPRSSENFEINMSLSLEGIGAALSTEDEFTVVQRIIAGGPAAMSEELEAEDKIVGVGQGETEAIVDVVSWRLDDVVDLIRGPKGSTVRLKIIPSSAPAGAPPKIITLVRDKIKLEEQAAKSSVIELDIDDKTKRFGVIDLPTFYHDAAGRAEGLADYRSTTRDVQRLLQELTTMEGGVDGIIMDLRGNGGGSLLEATQLTGLFIETGPIVQIRNGRDEVEITTDDDASIAFKGPLAVLVDRGSASASEIFAAAIQDYNRGIVVGEPTFGKGTVQSVAPLDRAGNLGQLKLTIAQFFRINGEGTQHRGVVPDVLFPTALDSDAQGERGLDNALPWAQVAGADYDSWSKPRESYLDIQSRHEARYQANESFGMLLKELNAQRVARSQNEVTLLETDRKRELEERNARRDERQELYRRALGLSGNDDDTPDILLDEAARVLSDVIDSPLQAKP